MSYTGDNNTAYTFFKYGYKNINLFTNEYSDPDGEELFEVLRHLYNNQEDTKIDPYYDFEYHYSVTSYLFMNKYSVNKDVAADFMCYMFDALNKDIESAVHMTYPVPDEGAEYTPYWLYWSNDLVEPLTSAKDELMISDGSDEAIRKLAEDAARGLRMRLEG